MRIILALALAILCRAADGPADLGGPAPGFDGVDWRRGAAPAGDGPLAVIAFPPGDGPEQPALALAADGARRALLAAGDDPGLADIAAGGGPPLGVAAPPALERWFGAEDPPLPSAALVGADGVLLWRGRIGGLAAALERERSGGYDRTRLRAAAELRARLRAALAAEPAAGRLPEALGLTAAILALDALDEEALRLRLDLARHLGERGVFRATLAELPLGSLPAGLANELAWERATDADLAWRHPDLALRLAEHAHRLAPDDAEVQDTYARVLYLLGELDAAVAAQLRAVSLAPEDPAMRDALDYYREVQALRLERLRAAP